MEKVTQFVDTVGGIDWQMVGYLFFGLLMVLSGAFFAVWGWLKGSARIVRLALWGVTGLLRLSVWGVRSAWESTRPKPSEAVYAVLSQIAGEAIVEGDRLITASAEVWENGKSTTIKFGGMQVEGDFTKEERLLIGQTARRRIDELKEETRQARRRSLAESLAKIAKA